MKVHKISCKNKVQLSGVGVYKEIEKIISIPLKIQKAGKKI